MGQSRWERVNVYIFIDNYAEEVNWLTEKKRFCLEIDFASFLHGEKTENRKIDSEYILIRS